ncbi:type VI secretion system baseplate subunit TssF [Sphingomonas sp. H160509]|nr:type VI secretion system baseplate subunit TssF [Sphingomonas sp. H160509]MDD1451076.1 type VI secretion system baseplate subunit TssF [Sphingomonas sp. H160509]
MSELAPGPLPLYLDGSQAIPGELYRQLVADAVSVVLRPCRQRRDSFGGFALAACPWLRGGVRADP